MKDNTVILEDIGYTIFDFVSILNSDNSIQLDSALREKVVKCRQFLDDKISDPNAVFYGINTGFGSLCNTKINSQDLSKLQSSLVLSHACGMGDEIPYSIAKLIFLL
ncbi:MAG TPA: aromatic amino acid lyase, partial [Saprospiraceae bacterium]|nr:aromatic amino acid lyase [Saprospiraceae bacterium]